MQLWFQELNLTRLNGFIIASKLYSELISIVIIDWQVHDKWNEMLSAFTCTDRVGSVPVFLRTTIAICNLRGGGGRGRGLEPLSPSVSAHDLAKTKINLWVSSFWFRCPHIWRKLLLRSAMAGRLYKLQSKHTSNSGFDQTFLPRSGYILFAAEQRVGYQISWVDLQREVNCPWNL